MSYQQVYRSACIFIWRINCLNKNGSREIFWDPPSISAGWNIKVLDRKCRIYTDYEVVHIHVYVTGKRTFNAPNAITVRCHLIIRLCCTRTELLWLVHDMTSCKLKITVGGFVLFEKDKAFHKTECCKIILW